MSFVEPPSTLTDLCVAPGSYRDPAGQVFVQDGRIFRSVTACAAEAYEFVRDTGLLADLASRDKMVATTEVDHQAATSATGDVRYLLEHPTIPYISYPYEWPFALLRAAALHHLDLHLELLERGATLSDASAYNVQFLGVRPVFIDVLSLRRYRDGEYWSGHRQFCEQFLNPLLLQALLGIPHQAWYRGSLEGIPTTELARLIPLRRRLGWNVLIHVVLQARLHGAASRSLDRSIDRVRARRLSLDGFRGLLTQLRRWIARLQPTGSGATVWADYVETHGYRDEEKAAKERFVAEFVERTQPRLLYDLGCNTGDYARLALAAGAERVIGFDADHGALELACRRAAEQELAFLPLFLDAANPSPSQGWQQTERTGFDRRARPDAVVALAFAHHLAIGRNVPPDQLLAWLTGLAPRGVVEFVPKSDPAAQRMLALRDDIFANYGEDSFVDALASRARIVRRETISEHGRQLLWYDGSVEG